MNDIFSIITAILTWAMLGVLLLSLVILIVPSRTLKQICSHFKGNRTTYDDGKDFKPFTKQQQAKILRRQHIEQKRQKEADRQQKERLEQYEQQKQEQYRKAVKRAAREQAEAEAVFEAFIQMLEEEYRAQLKRRAQWDEQEARRHRQQQQSKFKQQRQNSKDQPPPSRFAGMMGHGAQAVPDGCEGPVEQVLLAADYYQVLAVSSSNITAESLRTARKNKVLSVHPDKVGTDAPGANIAVGRVNVAYEVLSNQQMRSEYDEWLTQLHVKRTASVH